MQELFREGKVIRAHLDLAGHVPKHTNSEISTNQ